MSIVLVSGCVSPTVEVDGRGFADFGKAGPHIGPGSVVRLLGGATFDGPLVLSEGVEVHGPGTLQAANGTVITGEGALTLVDVDVRGGSGDDGTSIVAGALTLDGVTVEGGPGPLAIVSNGDLDVRSSTLIHPSGKVLETRSPVGRPASARLEDVVVEGLLTPHADTVDIVGLTGAAELAFRALSAHVEASDLVSLEVDARTHQLVDLDMAGPVVLEGGEAAVLAVAGGTWLLDLDALVGLEMDVAALGGQVEDAQVTQLSADLLQLQDGARLELREAFVGEAYLTADVLAVDGLSAHTASLGGLGEVVGLTLDGPRPQLVATTLSLAGVVMRSTDEAVWLRLEGSSIDGLIAVEPSTAVGGLLVETSSYAVLRNATFIGGARTAITPDAVSAYIADSLFEAYALGGIGDDTQIVASSAWSFTETLVPFPGLDIERPGFLGAGDPILGPDAPHPERGALASPYAAVMVDSWTSLR
ncbi:MAG: hypothetical protein H6736_20070 [Alphaproteobacteria bacterium]|nr:hypothetical protein [Alphaproteobacteria bacterium]